MRAYEYIQALSWQSGFDAGWRMCQDAETLGKPYPTLGYMSKPMDFSRQYLPPNSAYCEGFDFAIHTYTTKIPQ